MIGPGSDKKESEMFAQLLFPKSSRSQPLAVIKTRKFFLNSPSQKMSWLKHHWCMQATSGLRVHLVNSSPTSVTHPLVTSAWLKKCAQVPHARTLTPCPSLYHGWIEETLIWFFKTDIKLKKMLGRILTMIISRELVCKISSCTSSTTGALNWAKRLGQLYVYH